MPADWEIVPPSNLVSPGRRISYGIVQPGIPDRSGVPIVRVSDIRNGQIEVSDPLRVSPAIEAGHARTRLRGGELLLTLVGTVGETAIVPESLAGWNTARAVAVIPVQADVGAYWVQLALRAPGVRETLEIRLNTTVQATLNLRDVAQLPIVLPPVGERRRIAEIIGSLDDKIDLNRRMNETLEAMARAIFKSWFVDFDSVYAKAEGRDPGLSEPIGELFPDYLEDSEFDEIPAGWQVKPVGHLADIVGGSTPSTKEPANWEGGSHHWATPKDLSALRFPVLLNTERRITDQGLAQISSGVLPTGTVLMSSRAPIGYLAIAEVPVAINQGFIAMKPKAGVSNLFLLWWAQSAQQEIVSRANGSTFLEISKANFRPIPIVLPDAPVMELFERAVRPLYARIVAGEQQSNTIATLRDTLLPKLISGEVRVPEAARVVEAAGG
jgi:type I restriction enzyme S subunit